MKPARSGMRFLFAALFCIASLPLAWLVAEWLHAVPTGLTGAAVTVSLLLCVASLLVFEPPQGASLAAWCVQLRRRFDAVPSTSHNPPSKE